MKYKKLLYTTIIVGAILGFFVSWLYNSYFTLDPYPQRDPKEEQALLEEKEKNEIAKQLGEYTVLLLGVDSSSSFKTRTDTIMLATVDAETRKARLISIPRDTRVKIKGSWDKINAAYVYGGVDLAKQTVEDFLGVKVDRYVIVNFNSLTQLVDAVGGIEVEVPFRMLNRSENIDLQPGRQILNGKDALAYSRFRDSKHDDIERAKRQQEVIQILAKKIFSVQGLRNLPELVELMQENVKTDVPVREIFALAKLAPDIIDNGIVSVVVPGKNERIDGLWYWSPDLARLEQQLRASNEEIHDIAKSTEGEDNDV
ncbi:MAG: LCP family protein [Clostridia bacterium]|nr:LCP family protein [Clostridia bacterium]